MQSVNPVKRKGLPYKTETGDELQDPPLYVSSILNNKVQLEGPEKEFERLNLERVIVYAGSGPYENNSELISIVLQLLKSGVAFGYDYKTPVSPGAFMQNLQDSGKLSSEYKEISWAGKNKWTLTTYEMEKNV
jgi:hypothetical protein